MKNNLMQFKFARLRRNIYKYNGVEMKLIIFKIV